MNGIINVLKPPGMTSHDVVYFIRRTLNIKKVGHTGTLDPNAAGVLPICIGKATKVTQYLLEKNKKYRAELTLGASTDTQDKYGKIISESPVDTTNEDINKVFNQFIGEIDQIPPMFSALKQNGKKLYELARENKVVERKARKVTINDLKILNIDKNKILFDVDCSKGTYVRTLCNDIGLKLNNYGYMSFLLRTEVGVYNISNSYTLDEIKMFSDNGRINEIVTSIDYPLVYYKNLYLDERFYDIIINGGKINLSKSKECIKDINIGEKIKVYCKDEFIGIGKLNYYNECFLLRMERVLR